MLLFKKSVFLIFFLCFITTVTAQVSFTGKVVDGITGQALPGASIYFNNTSIGTSSGADGRFSFTTIAIVNTELIISSVGYEVLVFKIDASSNGKHFLCQLKQRQAQLKEVLILPDATRKRWLAVFKKNFLGITEEAAASKIENLKDIYFTAGDNRNSFKAYADAPLVIINKKLGYKISFQLVEFSNDEKEGSTYYYGYTRYEEMGDKKKWIKNRKKVYYGSTMHFYRSLISDHLKEDAFDLYLIKTIKTDTASAASSNKMAVAVTISRDQIIHADSLNAGHYILSWKDKLMVQYNKNPASKKYLQDRIFLQGNLPGGVRSYIVMKETAVGVDKDGIVDNPLGLEYSGYWMYEKAASLLPYNYQPD